LNLGNRSIALNQYIELIKNFPKIDQIINETEECIVKQKQTERKTIIENPIQCLTFWGSKGLKEKTVFILGLEEGYLPILNKSPQDEEIRLLYVAITRAIENAYLLWCRRRHNGVHSVVGGTEGQKECSVFIEWLPRKCLNIVKKRKKDFNKT